MIRTTAAELQIGDVLITGRTVTSVEPLPAIDRQVITLDCMVKMTLPSGTVFEVTR